MLPLELVRLFMVALMRAFFSWKDFKHSIITRYVFLTDGKSILYGLTSNLATDSSKMLFNDYRNFAAMYDIMQQRSVIQTEKSMQWSQGILSLRKMIWV